MDIKITPSVLKGEIEAVSSKSSAHRIFIASALSDKPTHVYMNNPSEDVKATLECLKSLGAIISGRGNEYVIYPIKREMLSAVSLNAVESGSTLRFLLPVASALCDKCEWEGEKSIKKRPIRELLYAMKGVGFSSETLPFTVNGKLVGGEYNIVGNISSQYISGLLFALPLLEKDSTLTVTRKKVSAPYIDMTIDVMSKFGVNVQKTENGYRISGNQEYVSVGEITVEGDYSSASAFIVSNYLGGEVSVKGLSRESFQGDKKVFELAEKIKGGKKTVIDAGNCPDLLPVLSVLAAFSKGETSFVNAGRLKGKESDRLTSSVSVINKMGGKATVNEDGITVTGTEGLKGGVYLDCFGDHRIAMAATIAGTFAKEPVTVLSAECVNKSYPNFFNDYVKLGGKANVL